MSKIPNFSSILWFVYLITDFGIKCLTIFLTVYSRNQQVHLSIQSVDGVRGERSQESRPNPVGGDRSQQLEVRSRSLPSYLLPVAYYPHPTPYPLLILSKFD